MCFRSSETTADSWSITIYRRFIVVYSAPQTEPILCLLLGESTGELPEVNVCPVECYWFVPDDNMIDTQTLFNGGYQRSVEALIEASIHVRQW